MQSPLATAEPAHNAPRRPVEGAATVLPGEMGMERWGREAVKQQQECKGGTGESEMEGEEENEREKDSHVCCFNPPKVE